MKSTQLALIAGCMFMALPAFAAESVILKTPRGTEVHVTVHVPKGSSRSAMVVAPGQSCNSKGPLFETLGQMGMATDTAVVRFEWSYCNGNPSQPNPSQDLKNEIEDYQTVLAYTKSLADVNKSQIVIAGKSLGSLVAFKVFAKDATLRGLALLTPICTYTSDENGKPLAEPQIVTDENYPQIKADRRPILMTMGNGDSLCLLPKLYDFLKDSRGNISTYVAGGDHGFRTKDVQGNLDIVRTERNIGSVATAVYNWLGLIW